MTRKILRLIRIMDASAEGDIPDPESVASLRLKPEVNKLDQLHYALDESLARSHAKG